MKKQSLIALMVILTLIIPFSGCKSTQMSDTLSNLHHKPGTWNGSVYSSEFLNTTVSVPNGWTIATEQELEQGRQTIITDSMEDSQATKEEIERGIIYEFKLTNHDTYSTVNLVLKDMDIIYSMAYNEEDFMDVYCKNMQQLEIDGMYISKMSDPEWVTLGGSKYLMCELQYDIDGHLANYQKIYLRKIGTYMANLTIAGLDKRHFDGIENMFTEYKE